MIWDPRKGGDASPSGIVSFVTTEVASLCDSADGEAPANVDELALAIEHFLKEQEGDVLISSRQLLALVSRALYSIGEDGAAKRLLVFGSGMARPSEWMVTQGDSVLVLDLKSMNIRDDSALELVFFSSLNLALESIAEYWDATGGQGVLGLRHVCIAARLLLGEHDKKKAARLVCEIKTACEAKLSQLKGDRCWDHLPTIINLDL